jgi:hypothetical protein
MSTRRRSASAAPPALSATNLANKRYLFDESNTFGGTHHADPRQVAVQISHRIHY